MNKKITVFKNILIIRLDSLGDTLLSTPVIRSLKEEFPESNLIYLVTPSAKQVVDNNPYINEVITFDYYKSSLKEKINLGNILSDKKIDLVINLSEKFWTYWWANKTRAYKKIGFYAGRSQPVKSILIYKWLSDRVEFSNYLNKKSKLHETERYFELLKEIGINKSPGLLEIYFDSKDEYFIQELIKSWSLPPEVDLLGLNLSGKWFSEGWDKEHLYKLIYVLLDKYVKDFLVLSYGPQEKKWTDSFISRIKSKRLKVFYNENLRIFAALIKAEKVLITPDTLAAHIASAVKTKVIDIFDDKFFSHKSIRWAPWKTENIVIKRPSLDKLNKIEKNKTEQLFTAELLKSIDALYYEPQFATIENLYKRDLL